MEYEQLKAITNAIEDLQSTIQVQLDMIHEELADIKRIQTDIKKFLSTRWILKEKENRTQESIQEKHLRQEIESTEQEQHLSTLIKRCETEGKTCPECGSIITS